MSLFHIGSDTRRFGHGLLPPAALAVICLLPLIFGGMFVWAYFDPFGELDQLPVAVVNSDTGAEGPDGRVEAGDQVVDGLLENHALNFVEVDAEEAREGIAQGRYYLGIEIPEDFSAASVSVRDEQPHPATINVVLSNTNGFIPTMLGNNATTIMTDTIGRRIGHEIVDQLFVGYNTLGDGIDRAADGAGQLDDGAHQLNDGTAQLADGTGTASNGAGQLADGAGRLRDGLSAAESGIGELQDGAVALDEGAGRLAEGAATLDAGLGTASTGADSLAEGMTALQGGTDQLGAGAQAVAGGVDQIAQLAGGLAAAGEQAQAALAPLEQLAVDVENTGLPGAAETAAQIRAVAGQVAAGTTVPAGQLVELQAGAHTIADQLTNPEAQYRSGIDTAAAGSQELADGLRRLSEGSGQLVAGTATLSDGTGRLVVGVQTLADGSSQLSAGSQQLVIGADDLAAGLVRLDEGAGALHDGSGRLADGTSQLRLSMSDASGQVPRWEGDRLNQASDTASAPVTRELVAENQVPFGAGMSPFFVSLSMWFGALAMFMVLRPLSRRAMDSGTSPFRVALTSYLPAVVIGLIQATLVWLVQTALIGVHPQHPVGYLLGMFFVSAVFVAVVQSINALLGTTSGRLVVMVLMSFQLVASNGLYPPEMQPRFFQWLHTIDPMRFSVDLFRHALFGVLPSDHRLLQALVVLTLIGLGGLALSTFAAWRHRVIMYKDLHPELSI
ncbi:YhgE/Pip family protein [Corynebacterium doosanense]|uniref:Membrane protein n=1 Tax=Corynebacterium doosanense CAU 212 = DSM 45436 TaxID=558173 RepID=A0A097IGE3_9CORY|nr:YhgE/Pip domain-containing protein [Corynebacterium doosanense]AIT61189.1 membrane protein [Corynebacterium doosanense CAU 212 = DSM 45436]